MSAPAGPWFHAAALLVLAAVSACIVSTYTVLSHTVDEPTHIAAGMEWLERGTQQLHAENPPLSRVAVGLGAHLAGHRLGEEGRVFQLGTQALYEDGAYRQNLVRARLGALPFFLLAVLLVWLWTLRLAGGRAAFVATASFAMLPPVMAHAGLATTDLAFVSTFLLCLFTFDLWLERAVGVARGGLRPGPRPGHEHEVFDSPVLPALRCRHGLCARSSAGASAPALRPRPGSGRRSWRPRSPRSCCGPPTGSPSAPSTSGRRPRT